MSKIRTGIIVSNKMNQTVIVRVDRMVPHKKYGKLYRVSENFAAHDPNNEANIGDKVTIFETKPISKTKTWAIQSIEHVALPTKIEDEIKIADEDNV